MYRTTSGETLTFSSERDELAAEYVLQRHRYVWVVTPTRPYLAIDKDALLAEMEKLDRFTLISQATVFQNMTPQDLKTRLASLLVGSGITASTSPKSDAGVEGEANPQAWVLQRWNPLLHLGVHAFAAYGTRYISIEPERIFQRSIGEYVSFKGQIQAEVKSEIFDFRKLARLVDQFHDIRLGESAPPKSPAACARMLDDIFAENEAVLAAIEAHHVAAPGQGRNTTIRLALSPGMAGSSTMRRELR